MSYHKKKTAQARNLRKSSTKAERLLWLALRDGRLEGLRFRRQAPVGKYILDFACPSLRLAIELDGASHPFKREYEEARDTWLEAQGWVVLHLSNLSVLDRLDAVKLVIYESARKRVTTGN